MLVVFLLVFWSLFSGPLFMEMKQREREGVIVEHKAQAGRGTRRSVAGILRVGVCYPSITSPLGSKATSNAQGSTYAASSGSRGTWKSVVTPAPALKEQKYPFWKQPQLSCVPLKLQSQRPFEYIIIYMAWEFPAMARGPGCHRVSHSVSYALPSFVLSCLGW